MAGAVMEKSFAAALRHSRLASFDRSLKQVYTTSKNCKQTGNWGLKRNLPAVVRTPYITVGDLDTAEHQTPWESGSHQVLFVRCWKENFPGSKRPDPRPEELQQNVALMSPKQFKEFIRSIRRRRAEFQAKLAKKELVPEQVYEFIHARFDNSLEATKPSVVGPTYSDYQVEPYYPVRGRILNATPAGHAVGVAGIVALLPRLDTFNLRNRGDPKIRTFYVQEAKINHRGEPQVTLRLSKPSSSSLSSSSSSPIPPPTTDPYASLSAEDMFLIRESLHHPIDVEDTTEEQRPSVDHENLMKRFSSLLSSLDDDKDKK